MVPAEPAEIARQAVPVEFLDLARVELIPVKEWGTLFNAAGWPDGIAPATFGHNELVTALGRSLLPDPLLDALQCIADLGTPEGIDELLMTASARGYPSTSLGSTTNPPLFVLQLWLRHHEDRRLATVLRLAQLAQHKRAGPSKTHREFVGSVVRPYPRGTAPAGRIRAELEQAIVGARMGPGFDLLIDDEGRTATHVFVYAGREEEHLVATMSGRKPQRMRFVACDVLQYDARDGRLSISTRSRGLVREYQAAMGRALFDDPSFFDGDALWSLDGIQREGLERLADHGMVSEVSSVVPRKVVWRPDDNNRAVFDGADSFDMLRAHPWQSKGRLLELELELRFWGTGSSRACVTIKVPNRREVRPERYRAPVDRYLRAVGIRKALAPSFDLWSVVEGAHAEEELAEALGANVERLQESGLVRPANRRSRVGPERGIHEELLTIELPAGPSTVALSDDEVNAPEVIPREAARGNRIEIDVLAGLIARDLTLTGVPRELTARGLYDLGSRSVDEVCVRPILVAKEPADPSAALAAIEALRGDSCRPVLLVPTGRRVLDGFPRVEWSRWCGPFDAAWQPMLSALGLKDNGLWSGAAPGVRLLVHRREQRVRFDGVDIEFSGDQEFFFILTLAEQQREGLTTQQLAARLTGKASASLQSVYMLQKRTLSSIVESFQRASRVLPERVRKEIFAARKKSGGGYEIKISHQVL